MSPPRTTRGGAGTFPDAAYYEVAGEMSVFSWCPTPDGTGPAEQVHLHIGEPPGPVFVVRFKRAPGLDVVTDALLEHRFNVWGPRAGASVAELRELVRWVAQTVHQAHHEGALRSCPKSTCRAAMAALAKEAP